MTFLKITPQTQAHQTYTNDIIAEFLVTHLDEFGDAKSAILKAIEYALDPSKGGLILLCLEKEAIVGAVVVNATKMDDYIPANILVYIAVDKAMRGKGLGKRMVSKVIEFTQGGIALHVEPNNPAKHLYERLGFTNKYLEMRFQHNKV